MVAAIGRHSATDVVVSLDIERFFTAADDGAGDGLVRAPGVADEPARLLARLVTNAVPRPVRASLPAAAGTGRTRPLVVA